MPTATQIAATNQGSIDAANAANAKAGIVAPVAAGSSFIDPATNKPATSGTGAAPLMVTSSASRSQYNDNVNTLNQATGTGMPSGTAPGQSTKAQLGNTVGAAPTPPPGTTINIHPPAPAAGTPPPGWDATTYANFKAANPGLEPTPEDTAKMQAAGGSSSTTGTTTTPQPSGMDLIDPTAKQLLQQNIDDLTSQATQAKAQVDTATATMNNDPAMTAAAAAIKAQFDQLIQQQTDANAISLGHANTSVAAFGGLGPMSQNFLNDQTSRALAKVADLKSKEDAAILASNNAYKAGDIKAFNDAMTLSNKITVDKGNAVKSLLDAAQTATQNARQEKIDQQNLNHQNLQDAIAQGNLAVNQGKATLADQQATIDNAFKQQQITETQRHDLATEAISRATNGGAIGSVSGGSLPSVDMTSTGTPNAASQASFLASLPGGPTGDLATQVRAIANYTMNPADFTTRNLKTGGSITRAQIVTLAQQYDPSYSDQNYSVRQTYLKSLAPGGKTYDAIVSANKAVSHLTSFADTVSSLGNGGASATVNAAFSGLASPFSTGRQTKTSQANTEAAGVKDELAKFFKGTGATDVGSIETWSRQLDANATPGQLKGTVQGAITLMAGQLEVLTQKYVDTMGKAPAAPLLQPQTIQKLSNLKNQGYQVDVPGVYYTDPKAYVANGGTTDKLDAARTALVNAADPNNPPTPENVLQLAQLMNQ